MRLFERQADGSLKLRLPLSIDRPARSQRATTAQNGPDDIARRHIGDHRAECVAAMSRRFIGRQRNELGLGESS